MRIAFIGCGYVADFYAITLRNHQSLQLVGVFDRDVTRATRFAERYQTHCYPTLDALLADQQVDIAVNLTNPVEHYAITRACLQAGKHVYSEKPLAMRLEEAQALVALARERRRQLTCAPATLLSASAQTLWRLLRAGTIGEVWLVYAELDDGAVHQRNYADWRSQSGVVWPIADELATGCTIEHAAYLLGWLTAFFGPVAAITSLAACRVPDKLPQPGATALADDFSLTGLQFRSGLIGRLTCSVLAPERRSLTIIGSEGVLAIDSAWQHDAPVYLQRRRPPGDDAWRTGQYLGPREIVGPPPATTGRVTYGDAHDIDFAAGIADLATAVQTGRPPRLSIDQALHVLEITLLISQSPPGHRSLTTDFAPLQAGE